MGIGLTLVKLANACLPPDWKIVKISQQSGLPAPTWRWTAADQAQETNYYYLGPDLALARMRNGLYLYIDPHDESVGVHLMTRGYWENWVYSVVTGLLRAGDDVIEVGANFGYYTMAMAKIVGPSGSVTSYEANPLLAQLVQKSSNFNNYTKIITVIDKAASNEAGTVAFSMSRRNAGGGATIVGHPEDDPVMTRVETVRLDDVTEKAPRIIRIDAEGSELLILRGAERLLQRRDVIVCLEWDIFQMASRGSVAGLVDWLVEMEFQFWRIGYDSVLVPVHASDMATLTQCDIVMARTHPFAVASQAKP